MTRATPAMPIPAPQSPRVLAPDGESLQGTICTCAQHCANRCEPGHCHGWCHCWCHEEDYRAGMHPPLVDGSPIDRVGEALGAEFGVKEP